MPRLRCGVVPLTPPRTSWTAAELLNVEFPPVRWAVPNLLAEGLNLLAGAPKLGKSWLALNLAVSVASGSAALGKVDVDEGDVLCLALEDPGRRLQSRLRMVLGDRPGPDRLTLATTCDPMPEGGDQIRRWLDAHPDARLVIVDVFGKVRGRPDARQDRYTADYSSVSELKKIADDAGVCMLVVHHTRKMASEDFLDAVSGTQGLAGAADAVLVLTRSRGAAGAVLKVTGRDVEEAEHALDFDATTGRWRLLDGPASDYGMSAERRAILDALRDEPGLGPTAIADKSGVRLGSVKHLVRKMVDDGQLDTDGAGHYLPVHFIHPVHSSPRSPSGVNGERGEQSERLDTTEVIPDAS